MAAFDIEASSSSSGSFTYDVFLNFRGEETRNNFTGFLHNAMKREGINVFIDSEGLWGGEEIKSALLQAIKQSKISIPVFSEGYADSKWCLMELVEIVRCHTSNGQKILPIFLDVDPRDVRNQKGSFEESFQKHNGKFDAQTIKSWREALSVVGGLSGYHLKQVNMNQPELVKLVVDWALSELSSNCLAEVKNPIGCEIDDLGLENGDMGVQFI
ncbi:disease resistance protein L6-like isoform X2 [Macadamia integrifolia]|uniref:disease resistance protein L6-like isoform X1 n=1 Tax=Macadamia integrifolia TaxID=60698 RepID=UPI001C533FC4|nr:disease resistance protein L6-like isoform X1 [Macadamia integrifolia]XP_042477143.1 disease resistance protein L6-like isoform X2 [Macadamia integrifolia]